MSVDEVAAPHNRAALFEVCRRLLSEADRYYASSWLGISQLPFRSAWAVAAANAVYRDIGRMILARGPSAWEGRTSTSTQRKLALALTGGARAIAVKTAGRGPASRPRTGLWTRPR